MGDLRSSAAVDILADSNMRPVATVTTAPASITRSMTRRVLSEISRSGPRMVPSMSRAISL